MQEAANKQKRITLKTIHQMLDGMSVELAEKVHLLFMANYIDYSDYDFRDDGQVESYIHCFSWDGKFISRELLQWIRHVEKH